MVRWECGVRGIFARFRLIFVSLIIDSSSHWLVWSSFCSGFAAIQRTVVRLKLSADLTGFYNFPVFVLFFHFTNVYAMHLILSSLVNFSCSFEKGLVLLPLRELSICSSLVNCQFVVVSMNLRILMSFFKILVEVLLQLRSLADHGPNNPKCSQFIPIWNTRYRSQYIYFRTVTYSFISFIIFLDCDILCFLIDVNTHLSVSIA